MMVKHQLRASIGEASMKTAISKTVLIVSSILILVLSTLSLQAHAGGAIIIIGASDFDRHHYSGNSNAHRLTNKFYFDNKYRRNYRDNYRNRYYNSGYYGDRSYRKQRYYGYDNGHYNYRRGYRDNRSYCPY
jgi:hypothetical protein